MACVYNTWRHFNTSMKQSTVNERDVVCGVVMVHVRGGQLRVYSTNLYHRVVLTVIMSQDNALTVQDPYPLFPGESGG